jgi:hypothetical protein
MQHAVSMDIIDIAAFAAEHLEIFDAFDRLSDEGGARVHDCTALS